MPKADINRGGRLRNIRKTLRETQTEFGRRFNISQNDVSRYERGRMPDEPILKGLYELGFSLDWLLTGQGEMKRNGKWPYPPDRDYSVLRDADLSPAEKDRKLLKLIKELIADLSPVEKNRKMLKLIKELVHDYLNIEGG